MLQISLGDDGLMHPVAFDGRKLRGAELNYPTHEKELLAIKEALVKFKHYIENNHKTTILTDHESLRYMNSVTRPSKRLARWIDEFQGFDLDIRYRRGKEAIVPDALSRRPDYLDYLAAIGVNLRYDDYISHLKEYLISKVLLQNPAMRERVTALAGDFIMDVDQTLLRKLKNGVTAPYIEPLFRGDFMEKLHSQFGHLSYPSIANAIETRGWWPTLEADMRRFISACPNCQISQRQRVNQEKEHRQMMTDPFIRPFQRWGIDLIGILPKTAQGNRWIITAVDYATGWPVVKAVPNGTQDVIADFIYNEIYMHYGAPQEIFSDGGKNLWGGVIQSYLKKIGTQHKGTSPYHPRTNGKVERLNGILGDMISKMLFGKPTKLWDLYLDTALFASRIRTNSTTKTSPFYLLYGQQPHLHGDPHHALPSNASPAEHEEHIRIMSSARQEATRATFERALRDRKVRDDTVTPHTLEVGDWVLVRHETPQKFESKWFGPYQIVQKMLLGTYRLQDPNGRELQVLVHGNRLLKANISTTDELRKLWASPATKDQLRKRNVQTELVASEPENTRTLERCLLEVDEEDPDPEPLDQMSGPAAQTPKKRRRDDHDDGRVMLKIPRKRWLEQIALEELTTKRRRQE